MHRNGIAAYDDAARVRSYDAVMEVMHPNRRIMVERALDVLPFGTDTDVRGLDLGIGTGYFSAQFLRRFPNGRVVGIDGAATMLDVARSRLDALANRTDLRTGDVRHIAQCGLDAGAFDVAFSSFTLHHLDAQEKEALMRQIVALLRPGGWFVNADVVVAAFPDIESRIQQLRVDGIVRRAHGADPRFIDATSARRVLDELELRERDQPLTLAEDLDIMRRAGLQNASAFWLEYRELVSGGSVSTTGQRTAPYLS